MAAQYKNPMLYISHWVKGEVYSLESLTQCVNEMLNMDNLKKKTASDIAEIRQSINKLNGGQFTLGSMMKSNAEKKVLAV
jgi:hypothetical protein